MVIRLDRPRPAGRLCRAAADVAGRHQISVILFE